MREPRVGEIWQNEYLHSQGQEVYEHVVAVEGTHVLCTPVGEGSFTTGTIRYPLVDFMVNYFYAF